MKGRIIGLAILALTSLIVGCSNDTSKESAIFSLSWGGKDLVFYESSSLNYTDGSNKYSLDYQMLNSQDNTERLYVRLCVSGSDNNKIMQNGQEVKPISSFAYKQYNEQKYQDVLESMKTLGLVDEALELSDVYVEIYSLQIDQQTVITGDEIPDFISRRWHYYETGKARGIKVDFTLAELEEWIGSWQKVNIPKNQITVWNKKRVLSWQDPDNNSLIYSNGMNIHVPEIIVSTIELEERKIIEIENRLDYSKAYTEYYELNVEQFEKFSSWVNNLKVL